MSLTREQLIELTSIPSGYAKFKLSFNLHPIQAKVVDALFDGEKSKVIFLCGNEVGKTRFVCVSAILFALHVLDATVVFTSASQRQVLKQVMQHLKEHSTKYNKNWEFLDNGIKINGESRLMAFSTDSDKTFQGFHKTESRPLVIIADEGGGVPDEIFQSIFRCNPDYLLITGSPFSPEGFFYSACTEPNTMKPFKHFKLTKYECLKKHGWWLDEEDIQTVIDMYGIDHSLVRSTVFAEFAANIEGGIISLADIEKCIRNSAIPDHSGGKHAALDFAAGGDSNVIAFRNGNEIKIIKVWKDKDTMNASRTFINELDALKKEYNISASDVTGDDDGLGKPMIDRIHELGWTINRFHGNSTAKDTTCKNLITDYWINACRKIRNLSIIMPNSQELKLQLTSRKSYMNQTGKLQLESKEDMRSRGIPSPDIADAFCIAIGAPQSGLLTFAQVPLPQPKKYTGYF